jgi:hypothetical protein
MRADAFLGGDQVAERVRTALDGVAGIRLVRHTAQTGSLLVEYDPAQIEANRVIAIVAGAAGLDEIIDGDKSDPADLAGAVIDVAQAANSAVVEVSGGRTDLRGLMSAALAGASMYSLLFDANGPRVPRWDNLLWWSYSLMNEKAKAEKRDVPPPPTNGEG